MMSDRAMSMVERAVEMARANLERYGRLVPVALVMKSEETGGGGIILALDFSTQKATVACLAGVTELLESGVAAVVVVIGEAYRIVRAIPTDERPSECDDRVECVAFSVHEGAEELFAVPAIEARDGRKTFGVVEWMNQREEVN